MAAKKPTKPRKFKQARKDAKSAAKQAFSGKSQAGLKDRTLRISADDKEVLSEIKKEAKGNYITDDRGNKIQVKPTETPQERMARDRREAKAQLQQKWDQEDGVARKPREAEPAKKPAPKGGGMNKTRTFIQATEVKPQGKVIKKKAAAKPAPAAEKPKVKKPAVKKAAAPTAPKSDAVKKGMTRAERSAANKAAWAKMTPEERKNWKGTKPAAAAPAAPASAPAASKPVTKNDAIKFSAKGKTQTPQAQKLKELQKKVGDAKSTAKKTTTTKAAKDVSTIGKVLNSPAGKVAKTAAMVLGPGKFLKAGSLVKGALAGTKTAKVAKAVKTAESGKKVSAANTARKAANAAKAEKAAKAGVKGKVKKVGLAAAGFYAIDKIPTGGGERKVGTSSTPSTSRTVRTGPMSDWSKRSSAKINKTFSTAGGSTTSYTVKKGDTLSGIAKSSGVKLSEVLAANPKIADKKSKYKGGSMIWSGTKVKLPTKKQVTHVDDEPWRSIRTRTPIKTD